MTRLQEGSCKVKPLKGFPLLVCKPITPPAHTEPRKTHDKTLLFLITVNTWIFNSLLKINPLFKANRFKRWYIRRSLYCKVKHCAGKTCWKHHTEINYASLIKYIKTRQPCWTWNIPCKGFKFFPNKSPLLLQHFWHAGDEFVGCIRRHVTAILFILRATPPPPNECPWRIRISAVTVTPQKLKLLNDSKLKCPSNTEIHYFFSLGILTVKLMLQQEEEMGAFQLL